MAEIAGGRKPSGHQYPDLLHWSAPRARADTLVELDDSALYVRGFGRAEAQSDPLPGSQSQFSWQWIKLETGQTLLIKRRSKLPTIAEEDRGLSQTQFHDECPSTNASSDRVDPEALAVEDVRPHDDMPTHSQSKDQSELSKSKADLEIMINYLEKHRYNDRVVGQALRRVVNKCTSGEIAAFLAVLIERLGESSKGHSK